MKSTMTKKLKCYTCGGGDDDCNDASVSQAPVICYDAILCWKMMVRETGGSRGCVTNREHESFYCNRHNGNETGPRAGQHHTVCCRENLCNDGPFPVLSGSLSDGSGMWSMTMITLTVLVPLVALGLLVSGIVLHYRNQKNRKNNSKTPRHALKLIESGMEPSMVAFSSPMSVLGGSISNSHELRAIAAGDSTLKGYLEGQSLTSGSGAGHPRLVRRTLAKHVSLAELLSNGGSGGNFGRKIWRGIWHGENVAVKVYCSRDEYLWTRETEVYSHLLPSRHDNILGYIGSDMISRAGSIQLWLVTHYHPLGSLYNYLVKVPQSLNHRQMFNICISIANGLLYLHTDIQGTQGKPSIAHRNLKTKNILIKSNGACVIADLAYSVTEGKLTSDKFDMERLTKRYMSPELLEQTLDHQCLEDFRRADIYSLGLIFWEVCRRCISDGIVLNYAAPYSEWLVSSNQEPTLEEMKELVVVDQRRPPIPNHWHSDPTLAGMGAMMKECWYTNATSRLTILRIKKTLIRLASSNADVDLPLD